MANHSWTKEFPGVITERMIERFGQAEPHEQMALISEYFVRHSEPTNYGARNLQPGQVPPQPPMGLSGLPTGFREPHPWSFG